MFPQQSSIFSAAVLDRKVQQNPKYKHIKPIVNTGNVRRNVDSLTELYKSNQYGLHEVFKRLKLSAFVRLIVQIAQDAYNHNLIDYDGTKTPLPEVKNDVKTDSLAPFQSVLMGIGEWDRKKEKEEREKKKMLSDIDTIKNSKPVSPYLLLDVRTNDEYNLCHIITAKNYPSSLLSRSVGYETKDLLLYKNVPKKLIILYDDEEALAAKVCTTLVQRGYDNIYLLCGGLRLAHEKFPKGLINGTFILPSQKTMLPLKNMMLPDLERQIFKDCFSEDDIHILQLALDVHFTASMTKGSKPASSYACRSQSSQRNLSEFKKKNIEQLQRLQLSARRTCSPMTKLPPWK